jgi:hypothetical protein
LPCRGGISTLIPATNFYLIRIRPSFSGITTFSPSFVPSYVRSMDLSTSSLSMVCSLPPLVLGVSASWMPSQLFLLFLRVIAIVSTGFASSTASLISRKSLLLMDPLLPGMLGQAPVLATLPFCGPTSRNQARAATALGADFSPMLSSADSVNGQAPL